MKEETEVKTGKIDYFYNEQGDYTITLDGEPICYTQDEEHAQALKNASDQIQRLQSENARLIGVLSKVNTAIQSSNMKNTILHDEIRKVLKGSAK